MHRIQFRAAAKTSRSDGYAHTSCSKTRRKRPSFRGHVPLPSRRGGADFRYMSPLRGAKRLWTAALWCRFHLARSAGCARHGGWPTARRADREAACLVAFGQSGVKPPQSIALSRQTRLRTCLVTVAERLPRARCPCHARVRRLEGGSYCRGLPSWFPAFLRCLLQTAALDSVCAGK